MYSFVFSYFKWLDHVMFGREKAIVQNGLMRWCKGDNSLPPLKKTTHSATYCFACAETALGSVYCSAGYVGLALPLHCRGVFKDFRNCSSSQCY